MTDIVAAWIENREPNRDIDTDYTHNDKDSNDEIAEIAEILEKLVKHRLHSRHKEMLSSQRTTPRIGFNPINKP